MRFDKIKARNFGPFKDVDVDIGAIPGQLVAVVGPNGAGKTTLIEALSGALYRQCPTRGTLASLATARDSFLEVQVCNGAPYTVRQTVDGHTGKGETLILDAAGTPVTESAKVRDGDRWVASHFPSAAELYTSSVAVQGRRGFLDLSKSERRQVLSAMLGIERYEQMAEGARERAKAAKTALEVLRARLGETPAPDMAALQARVEQVQAQVERAHEAAQSARTALERARVAAGDAARKAELAEQRKASEGRHAAAKAAVDGLEVKLRNNRAVLADGDAIRAAVERAAELDAAMEAAKSQAAEAGAALSVARAAEQQAAKAATRADSDVKAAGARVSAVQQRLVARDAVLAAVARVQDLVRQDAELANALQALEAQAAELESLVINGKDLRIKGLRVAIMEVEARSGDAHDIARNARLGDDQLAASAASAPEDLKALRAQVSAARAGLDKHRAEVRNAERLAARAPEMAQAEADLAVAQGELAAATTKQGEAVDALSAAAKVAAEAAQRSQAAQQAAGELVRERAGLETLVSKRGPLENAVARIEELEAMLAPARQTLQAADAELATLPVVTAEVVDLARYEGDVTRAQSAEHEARAALTRAQDAVVKGTEQEAKRAALQAEIAAGEGELSDWVRLGQDLGRDGLQALELDAALPELNEIANNLLHSTHGPRFTVELRTDRLAADGKKTIEDLELRVIDSVKGRDEDACTYSGGECVIVGEAVSLALTVVACRRRGIEQPTLVRDETGAALDQENGRAYMAMLRMAARQIGAAHVLFVSHTPELQELADARITVSAAGVVAVEA